MNFHLSRINQRRFLGALAIYFIFFGILWVQYGNKEWHPDTFFGFILLIGTFMILLSYKYEHYTDQLNAGAATIVALSALLMSRWLDASATATSFALLKLAHFDAEEKEKFTPNEKIKKDNTDCELMKSFSDVFRLWHLPFSSILLAFLRNKFIRYFAAAFWNFWKIFSSIFSKRWHFRYRKNDDKTLLIKGNNKNAKHRVVKPDHQQHHLPLELHNELILFASQGTLAKLAKLLTPPYSADDAAATIPHHLTSAVVILATERFGTLREKHRQRLLEFLQYHVNMRVPLLYEGKLTLLFVGNVSTYKLNSQPFDGAKFFVISKAGFCLVTERDLQNGRVWLDTCTIGIRKENCLRVRMDSQRRQFHFWKTDGHLISVSLCWQSEYEWALETLKAENWFPSPIEPGLAQNVQPKEQRRTLFGTFLFVFLALFFLLCAVANHRQFGPVPTVVAADHAGESLGQ